MIISKIKCNPFQNVGANQTAICDLSNLRGRSIHGFLLRLSGTTFARATHLKNARLKLGSKDLLNNIPFSSALHFENIFTRNYANSTSTIAVITLGNPEMLTAYGKHKCDLDYSATGYGANNLVMEIDIGAATAPALEMIAVCGPPKGDMGLGYSDIDIATLKARVVTTLSPSAAVSNQSQQIGLGSEAGALINRVFFAGANLTSIELKRNGEIVIDNLNQTYQDALAEAFAGPTVDALERPVFINSGDFQVIDMVSSMVLSDAMPTLDARGVPVPLQVSLTTSGATTITAWAELQAALVNL